MNSPNPYFPGILGSSDPKQVAIVETILKKTREKKILWNKAKNGFIASVSAPMPTIVPMRIEFHCTPTTFANLRTIWQNFVVTTAEGVILRVENSGMNAVFARLGGVGPEPLVRVTDELFDVVNEVSEGSLERAKNLLDQL